MSYLKKGDLVLCAKGHIVAEVAKDLSPGDLNWNTAFVWKQDDTPEIGLTYKPKCSTCGADIFDPDKGWSIRIQGWRP